MLLNLNLDVAERQKRGYSTMRGLANEIPNFDLSQFPAGSRIVQANIQLGMFMTPVWGVLAPDGTFYPSADKAKGTRNYTPVTRLQGNTGGSNTGGSNTGGNTNSTTTNSNDPCPCEDCTEEYVEDTYYLTKEQISGAKEYRTFTNKIICDSTDKAVQLPCEIELAKLRGGGTSSGTGMNGLRDIKIWNSNNYDDCVKQLNKGVTDENIKRRNRRTCFEMTGIKSKQSGDFGVSYEQHIAQANRLSLKGLSGCKSCGVSGLANDNTPVEAETDGANATTVYYTTDTTTLPNATPCGCGKAAFNMWAWIASLAGVAFLTWIITYMATKRR